MLKSRFRIAGEVLVIATLAGSAAAQSPRAPINTLNDLVAALLDCWVPPIEQSRPGMQITVLMSFKRNGELFGQPRITFQSSDASEAERALDTLLVKPFSHNRAARCRTAYAVQAQKHRREADAPDLARLLCQTGQRPRCRAAEQRDEAREDRSLREAFSGKRSAIATITGNTFPIQGVAHARSDEKMRCMWTQRWTVRPVSGAGSKWVSHDRPRRAQHT